MEGINIEFLIGFLLRNSDIVLTIPALISLSFLFHRTLILIGQTWVETFAHTATLLGYRGRFGRPRLKKVTKRSQSQIMACDK